MCYFDCFFCDVACLIMACSSRATHIVSFFFGFCALVLLLASVSSDYWLFTSEPLSYNLGNETFDTVALVHSGLWRTCPYIEEPEEGEEREECVRIEYVNTHQGRVEYSDVTTSVVRATRRSTPFFVLGTGALLASVIFSHFGHVQKNCKTLVASILYIITGMFLAVGVVLYVSSVSDELMHRSRPKPDEPHFSYHYGWSFFSAGTSFLLTEISAVICIFIYWNRFSDVEGRLRLIPGLYDEYIRRRQLILLRIAARKRQQQEKEAHVRFSDQIYNYLPSSMIYNNQVPPSHV